MSNRENSDSVKKVNRYTVFTLAFILFSIMALVALISVPNITRSRASARRKTCFSNMRVLQGAVEMYNMDSYKMMKTLDTDLLVKSKYLKEKPVFPEPDCLYLTEGDLTENGKIYCKHHGVVLNSEEERKLSQKEKSEELKGQLMKYFLLLTICLTPSSIYIYCSIINNSESYGCFFLILLLILSVIMFGAIPLGGLLV